MISWKISGGAIWDSAARLTEAAAGNQVRASPGLTPPALSRSYRPDFVSGPGEAKLHAREIV